MKKNNARLNRDINFTKYPKRNDHIFDVEAARTISKSIHIE